MSRTKSPHRARLQSGRHASSGSAELRAPLSHSSPASRTPSPQELLTKRQLLQLYPVLSSCFDCSHCSPSRLWTIPSPQIPTSSKQVLLQPSLSRRFLSSHSSLISSTPFPHTEAAATSTCSRSHRELQPSPLILFPSSHSSVCSTTPFPQPPERLKVSSLSVLLCALLLITLDTSLLVLLDTTLLSSDEESSLLVLLDTTLLETDEEPM